MNRIRRAERAVPIATLVAACRPAMSMFDPATASAARVTHFTWVMIGLAAVIFVIVAGLLAATVLRSRRRDPHTVDVTPRGNGWVIVGGAVLPALVLAGLFVAAMQSMGMRSVRGRAPALTIEVTGHQWWWEVEYQDSLEGRWFKTANEIHVPVGQTVRILLRSADVIHSFWVPNLQGKLDAIPGYENDLRLTVARPGTYRGQCAEYCGLQHANMAFTVVADDSMAFRRWEQAQRGPAEQPGDSLLAFGQQVFMQGACALCHAVRGSDAKGQLAPDLTHVGSRQMLAAGTIPNQLGTLEAWITNAQSFKPGTQMPSLPQFNGRELRALAAYVNSLQ